METVEKGGKSRDREQRTCFREQRKCSMRNVDLMTKDEAILSYNYSVIL